MFLRNFTFFIIALSLSSCFKEDKHPPVIVLQGGNNYNTKIGKAYIDPGFKATDNKDGDISNRVYITGHVDSSKAGIYYLRYNVSDASGNLANEEMRTVYVTHFNESLSAIYEAEAVCNLFYANSSNAFVVIETIPNNEKSINIEAINNLSRGEYLIGHINSNLGNHIIIPPQAINDTTYSGYGTVNPTGSEIKFFITMEALNYTDKCETLLHRPIR
ncbi:MAG: DUF5011 domain-containing protein [Bacteroidetes bacterium]|nr:DUF5011 domain-containing protein [Bacteroidota bacterium]